MLTTKKIVYIFLGFVAGFFVMVGLSLWARQPRWYFEERAQYYMQRATQDMMLQSERVLAEDTYGGYTPEETFAMFLDALRAGDTDLASKFFVVQKQEEWNSKLEDFTSDGSLSEIIEQWKNITNSWSKISSDEDFSK
ncbi:MAG: hypothetical protein Q8Q39_01530, partial [bacterium]|nr:hypothetical protein [bacterium]